ncbi:GntR family transcriptional regulator/MocR family aminotransferase [Caballeronia udeis]|uniref:GntR family transcriptional regulator/MocR family aminotransferase n=1 Tax=Caballeronia udeis TaxID=1232866 RepID=A0ABW8MY61_9BURK
MKNALSGLLDIELTAGNGVPLSRQLCDQLRDAILSGRLPTGYQLPSSRAIADYFHIARNTVSSAIDQLTMEGFIDVAQGRKPVITDLPKRALSSDRKMNAANAPDRTARSKWALRISDSDWPFAGEPRAVPFMPGLADPREFPHDLWARCLRSAARRVKMTPALGTVNRQGLQVALLQHLEQFRGVRAAPSQVIVTPSAQAALELISRLTLNVGDLAWVENPGYRGARAAIESVGARIEGVNVDASGLNFEGRTDLPQAIFVTPSHQYPTGVLMPVARRQALLRLASSVGAVIVEDDYDSEFHYDGRPVAALQSLDVMGNNVFYVGTFSKATYADIRVGYAVVPAWLARTFEQAQRHTGQIVSATVQDGLAEFINEGYFVSHIRKMTRIYRSRRDHLVMSLRRELGDILKVDSPAGGMQMLIRFNEYVDDNALSARLGAAGVIGRALSRHCIDCDLRGLFIGFAAWNVQELDHGVHVLASELRANPALR